MTALIRSVAVVNGGADAVVQPANVRPPATLSAARVTYGTVSLMTALSSGLLTSIAQSITGVKTFLDQLIAGAGISVQKLGVEVAALSPNGGLMVKGVPGGATGSLTDGAPAYLGSYNVNIGSAALWMNGIPGLTNFALANSVSGGLSTPVGTTLNGQYLTLQASSGSSSMDVVTRMGTTLAESSVHANAKLWSIGTGIGGTYTEHAYLDKSNNFQVGTYGANGYLQTNGLSNCILGYGYSFAKFDGNAALNGGYGSAYVYAGSTFLKIYSNIGTSASDVACKIGSYVADASFNALAKIASFCTGIDGTEVESIYFKKGGVLGGSALGLTLETTSTNGVVVKAQGTTICSFMAGGGVAPALNTGYAIYMNGGALCGIDWGAQSTGMHLVTEAADGASALALDVNTISAWSNAGARLAKFKTNGVSKLEINTNGDIIAPAGVGSGFFRGSSVSAGALSINDSVGASLKYGNMNFQMDGSAMHFRNEALSELSTLASTGLWSHYGTDGSATTGAQTINKPTGKAKIGSGVSSVVITNSLVTAGSRVEVFWEGDHGAARWWVVPGAGLFTVTLSGNSTAAAVFSFGVKGII